MYAFPCKKSCGRPSLKTFGVDWSDARTTPVTLPSGDVSSTSVPRGTGETKYESDNFERLWRSSIALISVALSHTSRQEKLVMRNDDFRKMRRPRLQVVR